MRLNCLLGSKPDCDEFQVNRMLVFVNYDPMMSRSHQLIEAEMWLPLLEADIPAVERFVATCVGSDVNATVIGVRISTGGAASYDCTFPGGRHQDEIFYVARTITGELSLEGE
jgi:hypothetical protein